MDFSNSGLFNAWAVALLAFSSPFASPNPNIAIPEFCIIDFISAKSKFTIPCFVIKSEIPFIPIFKTPFASLKAFIREIFIPGISNNLSFGIAINVSTFSLKLLIPVAALFFFNGPSKLNGFVTMATVKIPIAFATSAIIGDAPVPVPPPIPAVMNNISVPSNTSFIFSSDSFAAILPFSGSAPAPIPRPKSTFTGAWDLSKSCWSVLIAIKSTLVILLSIISFIAFPPAPPTPTTFSFAVLLKLSIFSLLLKNII